MASLIPVGYEPCLTKSWIPVHAETILNLLSRPEGCDEPGTGGVYA